MIDSEGHRLKTASNRARSAGLLMQRGIHFDAKNNGAHLIVYSTRDDRAPACDFWPGTGLWIFRDHRGRGRGVFKLMAKLG